MDSLMHVINHAENIADNRRMNYIADTVNVKAHAKQVWEPYIYPPKAQHLHNIVHSVRVCEWMDSRLGHGEIPKALRALCVSTPVLKTSI